MEFAPLHGSVQADELLPLLERLQTPHLPKELPDDYATVAAVAEAIGCSESEVWDALNNLRNEDLEARLAERLREAEEPLYRVERPGLNPEPPTFIGRQRAFQSILDTLPPLNPQKRSTVAKKMESAEERASRWAAWLILALTLLMFLVVGIVAVFTAIRGLPH